MKYIHIYIYIYIVIINNYSLLIITLIIIFNKYMTKRYKV